MGWIMDTLAVRWILVILIVGLVNDILFINADISV
jgi:hypothetical protein